MYSISLIERDVWDNLLNEFPATSSDIYFTPEYCYLYQFGTKEGIVKCIKFENDDGIALYPFLERDIPSIITEGKKLKDITTPYGYGGPISTNYSKKFLENFNKAIDEFFLDNGYVSEFIRFHPVIDNHKLRYCEHIYVHKTFGVDFLTESPFSLDFWGDSLKRGAKKGERLGLIFNLQDVDADVLSKFVQIYKTTMKRRNALKYYFFNDSYWNSLLELGRKKEIFIAIVSYNDVIVASAIFLTWRNTYIHYHLGGSLDDFLKMRPNNYLFWNVEKWAASNKFSIMHLGGGVKTGDGLEKFKSGISNRSFDFYIGKKVFNKDIYLVLNERAKKINEAKYDNLFFPPYRSIFRE